MGIADHILPLGDLLGSERPDLVSERPDLGAKGLHLQSGRLVLRLGGGTYVCTENGKRRKLPYVES